MRVVEAGFAPVSARSHMDRGGSTVAAAVFLPPRSPARRVRSLFDICAAWDLASLNRGRRNNRLASERYRAGRARRSDHARWCTSFVATNNPWSSRSVAAQRLLRRRSTRGRLPLRSGRDAQDRRRTGDTVVADPSFGPSTRGTAWPAPALGKLRRLDELYRIHEATAMRSMEWRAEGR